MGLGIWPSSRLSISGCGNPNPNNCKILTHSTHGSYLVATIKYPDCANYEGLKVLLFKDITFEELSKQKGIDPHFSKNNKFSPIARFEPTERGLEMCLLLVKQLESLE